MKNLSHSSIYSFLCFSQLFFVACSQDYITPTDITLEQVDQQKKPSDLAQVQHRRPHDTDSTNIQLMKQRKAIAFSLGGDDQDEGSSMQVDIKGNVYLAGKFHGSMEINGKEYISQGKSDFFVMKQDKHGRILWFRSFGGKGYDEATSLRIDHNGNLYVTGTFSDQMTIGSQELQSNGRYDIFIIKLSSDGNLAWSQSYGGTNYDRSHALTIDNQGNIYITGYFHKTISFGEETLHSKGTYDIFIAKLSSEGDILWSKNFGGSGKKIKQGSSVVTDKKGQVYIVGSFSGELQFGQKTLLAKGDKDAFIMKLDPSGEPLWIKTAGGTGDDMGISVVLSPQGRLSFLVSFETSTIFGKHEYKAEGKAFLVISLDTTGKMVWSTLFQTGQKASLQPTDLATDSHGNIFLTGSFTGKFQAQQKTLTSKGKKDIFILKLNSQGKVSWAESYGSPHDETSQAIIISPTGKPYITGTLSGTFKLHEQKLRVTGKSDALLLALQHRQQLQTTKKPTSVK